MSAFSFQVCSLTFWFQNSVIFSHVVASSPRHQTLSLYMHGPMGHSLGFLKNDEFIRLQFFCKIVADAYNSSRLLLPVPPGDSATASSACEHLQYFVCMHTIAAMPYIVIIFNVVSHFTCTCTAIKWRNGSVVF